MNSSLVPLHIQLQPFLLSRKNFYQVLHLLFLESATGESLFQIQQLANIGDLEEIHEGGKILRSFFDHLTVEQVQREQEEYERLFVGPGPIVAPPWESYYRSKEHLLFEEWTHQIREQYHRFGLQSNKENNEPDDHLLLELEFMIFLTDASLLEEKDERIVELLLSQLHFLDDHLTIWIPYFCKRVIENTGSQLYLGAAMLLEDFLSFDKETLSEVMEAIDNGQK